MEVTAAAAQAATYTSNKSLAEQINDYLATTKTSIATLASEIPGYSRPTISRYLSGKYEGDISTIEKLLADWLAQRTGEAVHLVIRDARDIVYIYKTESGPMRMSSRVGLRSPLYCTGVGKAILATLTEEEVEDVWRHSSPQKLTGRTVTDLPALCAQLNEVRACGYAIDDEENELGIRCVALAIPGPGGKADSAFSISGLAPYMTPERIRRIAALALETRADILRDLGVQGV